MPACLGKIGPLKKCVGDICDNIHIFLPVQKLTVRRRHAAKQEHPNINT